jgi:hypothetical protein
MPDDMPSSYFDSLLRGVTESTSPEDVTLTNAITLDEAVSAIDRVHALPGRPCGRAIAWLIEKLSGLAWPMEILEVLSWYAINDPDPDKEDWKVASANGTLYYGGDPYSAGINSTRGAMAHAIATLLFDSSDRYEALKDAIRSLAYDARIAVRSCAIAPLVAVLNVDSQTAIKWFVKCVGADPVLLSTPRVERFIFYAGYRDYRAVRSVIQEMLASSDAEVAMQVARQVCLLAFDVPEAEEDAETLRRGTAPQRKAAADVYSTNIAHERVGRLCRDLLPPLFADSDQEVRREAASAFQYIGKLSTTDQANLLKAFLDGKPDRPSLEPVIRALEDSSVQLPDLVCALAEVSVEAFKNEAGDISKDTSLVAGDLSKIVIRLYAQTEDPEIQRRCLNLMDEMERHHFMGLSDELQRVDR